MNKDLVSVIIPVYNTEKYLRECIESVRKQSYSNLQIILVNDGSLDNSGIICDEYKKVDSRIEVIHQENAGVSVARNHGLKYATGQWIAFVDSDDVLIRDAYEQLINVCSDKQMAIGKICLLNEDGSRNRPVRNLEGKSISQKEFLYDLFEEKKYSYLGFPHDKIFRREIIEKWSVRFDPNIKINEDRAFVLEYILHCDNINVCNHEIYLYRQRNPETMSKDERDRVITESVLTVITAFVKMQELGKKYSEKLYFLICRKSFESALDMLSRTKKEDRDIHKSVNAFLKESTLKCLRNPNASILEKTKIVIHYLIKR